MHLNVTALIASVVLVTAAAQYSSAQRASDLRYKIDHRLRASLDTLEENARVSVGVWLREGHNPDPHMVALRTAQTDQARTEVRDLALKRIELTQESILNWAGARGIVVEYRARYGPVVFLKMNQQDIVRAASRSDVHRLYASGTYQTQMQNGVKSMRADVAWARGRDGSSLSGAGAADPVYVGIVEPPDMSGNSKVNFGHDFLTHLSNTPVYPSTSGLGEHATKVAGIIAAAKANERARGVAHGLNGLISAGAAVGTEPEMFKAVDWTISQGARILNNSFGYANGLNLNIMDLYFDYVTRNFGPTMVVAAGNEAVAVGCEPVHPAANNNIVLSPGLAYNVITVGGFDSSGTTDWMDDAMYPCSSYLPDLIAGSGREKPELVAVASDGYSGIYPTYDGLLPVSGTGAGAGGTSFAAPAVTGAVALLAEQDPTLMYRPESVKAILMASACHNIEGAAKLSSKDGVGALVVCEALEVLSNGQHHHDIVTAADFSEFDPVLSKNYYGHTINLDAAGTTGQPKTARVVLTWMSRVAPFVFGNSTSISVSTGDSTLVDSTAPFGSANSKAGWILEPNLDNDPPEFFIVTSNTADTLTIDGVDITSVSGTGDEYMLYSPNLDTLDASLKTAIWDVSAGSYVQAAVSQSSENNFTITSFSPPTSGAYEIRVFADDFDGTVEPIALAWAQQPCCSPDWGDAPDDMTACLDSDEGDYPTLLASDGASADEFEVEWLSKDKILAPGASWEMDAHVGDDGTSKDQDGTSNIHLPTDVVDACTADLDSEDDGVEFQLSYERGEQGEVSFWVNSATPNVGRYASTNNEQIIVRGWFDLDQDNSWNNELMFEWKGGPSLTGQLVEGVACTAGCDLWSTDDHQKLVTVRFNVPNFADPGITWARVRLSYGQKDTNGYGVSPMNYPSGHKTHKGRTTYGEIEDTWYLSTSIARAMTVPVV